MIVCFQHLDTMVLVEATNVEAARKYVIKISGDDFWTQAIVMTTLKEGHTCQFFTT